jgi:meso-butanediol dehydrogenase/(S,S)-butanediol dehydrogenase/diacetyl reductase
MTMTDDIRGETVLITGAGSGIGAVMAARFAGAGATVAVVDIDGDAARRVASGADDIIAFEADVTDRARLSEVFGQLREQGRPVSVLVNNAMTCADADFLDLTVEEWERDLAVCLTAAFHTTQLALPDMLAAGRGTIVNISSVNALQYLGNVSYSAAKAGLLSLTRSIAVRYGAQGIRANAVVPGTIVTPAWDHRIASDPAVLDHARRWYPSTRLGHSDDVADAVLFLAGGRAGWINGETLTVDGGLMAGNVGMAMDIVPE